MSSPQTDQAKERFRETLELFCLFHLGSDAVIRIEETPEEISVALEHHRIEPFRFSLPLDRLRILVTDPPELEQYLLGQMTAHRR